VGAETDEKGKRGGRSPACPALRTIAVARAGKKKEASPQKRGRRTVLWSGNMRRKAQYSYYGGTKNRSLRGQKKPRLTRETVISRKKRGGNSRLPLIRCVKEEKIRVARGRSERALLGKRGGGKAPQFPRGKRKGAIVRHCKRKGGIASEHESRGEGGGKGKKKKKCSAVIIIWGAIGKKKGKGKVGRNELPKGQRDDLEATSQEKKKKKVLFFSNSSRKGGKKEEEAIFSLLV